MVNGHSDANKTVKNHENFQRKVLNMFKAYQMNASDDQDRCEVYKTRPIVRWSFFSSKEDIDNLLEALNPRGFRERTLREAIQQEYKQLTLAVEKCPLKEENQAQKKDTKPKGRRGGRNQPTVDKSRYKTMEEFLEANLRDQILDLEDRIWQGNLGFIRVVERDSWRMKVENGIYGYFIAAKSSEDVKTNGVSEVKENGDAPEPMEVDTKESTQNMETVSEMAEKKEVAEEKPMECDADVKPVVNGVKKEPENTGTFARGVGRVVVFLVLLISAGQIGSQRYTRKTVNGIVKVSCYYSISQLVLKLMLR